MNYLTGQVFAGLVGCPLALFCGAGVAWHFQHDILGGIAFLVGVALPFCMDYKIIKEEA